MGQDIIFFIVCTVITTFIGIVAYFLKRTMSHGDKNEEAISDLKDTVSDLSDKFTTTKETQDIKDDISDLKGKFSGLKDNFSDLSDKFATKEEVREIKEGMKEMSKNMDFIKENTIRKDEFVRLFTRLENKIDDLRGN